MDQLRFETKVLHAGQNPDHEYGATRVPIYQTAAFAHETAKSLEDTFKGRKFGYYYSRNTNPTITALEDRLTQLENGRGALAVGSGMAAISALVFSLAKSGTNFVAAKSLFGSTVYLFDGVIKDAGIDVRYVDTTDVAQYEAAVDENTQFIFIESVGNPKLDVPDISAISEVANRHGIPLVVDATFITPYLLDVAKQGGHVVVHATTKYLCGGGTAVGGVVIDLGNFDWSKSRSKTLAPLIEKFGQLAFLAKLRKVRSTTGAALAPQNAFYSLIGLDTLHLRVERHCDNAAALADHLGAHSKVVSVNYPGLPSNPSHEVAKRQFGGRYGGMLTFRVGSQENAYKVIDALKFAKNLVNLGDAKTLVVNPFSTIYRDFSVEDAAEAGVYEDLIRVSVGLEHIDDLKADFSQALDRL